MIMLNKKIIIVIFFSLLSSTASRATDSVVDLTIPSARAPINCVANITMTLGFTHNQAGGDFGYGDSCGNNPSNYSANDTTITTSNGKSYSSYINNTSNVCFGQTNGTPVLLCPGTYSITWIYNLYNDSGNCNGWSTDEWTGAYRTGTLLWSSYSPSCLVANTGHTASNSASFTLKTVSWVQPPMLYSIGNGNAFKLVYGTVQFTQTAHYP